MARLEGVSVRTIAVGLAAFIVIGGFVIALSTTPSPAGAPAGMVPYYGGNGTLASLNAAVQGYPTGGYSFAGGATTVTTTVASTSTMTVPTPPQTQVVGGNPQAVTKSGPTSFNQPGNGNLIEFFNNVTMESPVPSNLASRVVELAYSVGGYVAYQSTTGSSAYVVIRVPAPSYQQTLTQIQGMGNVTSLTSNSNDVTVKYTDLNATLASLIAERDALLKLINQSTSVNSTLAIYGQLQYVNAQINSVQSQILQTQRLISYSTITVSVTKSAEVKPLSMTLSATPKSGLSPLGVTFNAVVSGGRTPYIILYNFGDGTSQQGQAVIHQFYSADDYNVTVTATDSKGNTTTAWTMIHVSEPPTKLPGFGNFGVTLVGLLIRVVEGMAEIAVIVGPAVLVAAAVIYPLRRRNKIQKAVKQDQTH